MMHAWHIGWGNGLRAPRIPRPQLPTLPLAPLAFMGEKWDCALPRWPQKEPAGGL